MKEPAIALIAAMPEETGPLLRRVKAQPCEKLGGFPLYSFTTNGRQCLLMESGMGPKRAAAATKALLGFTEVSLLLNFGFGGAVCPGPGVGDIVIAERILCRHDRLFTDEAGLSLPLTEQLFDPLTHTGSAPPFRGTFITTVEIAAKKELATRLPANTAHPVLEMETAAVARVAAQLDVPLVAIRAVSDAAAEELGFAITDFTDKEMNIRIHKVLLAVAKKPGLIPQLLRLARNARIAGNRLAIAIEAAIANLNPETLLKP